MGSCLKGGGQLSLVHARSRLIIRQRSHAVNVLGSLNLLVAGKHSVKHVADFIGQFDIQVFQ